MHAASARSFNEGLAGGGFGVFVSRVLDKRITIFEFAANTFRDMQDQTRPWPTAAFGRSSLLPHTVRAPLRHKVELDLGAPMGAPQ